MSVRQAQREIDSAEFNEWMGYYSVEPFGEQIADIRHGIAVSTLANANRNAEKRPEPFEAADFIPWHESRQAENDEPILLEDPAAQGALIKAALFGIGPSDELPALPAPQQ